MIQVALLAALAIIAIYAFGQRRRSGPVSYGILAAVVAGAVLILLPDFSTSIANAVGVGRGADLVFYVFMLIILAAVLNIHLRLRSDAEVLTKLARELAILTARHPR